MSQPVIIDLSKELADAEAKAWDALSRYKFWMFGYWAAWWVHLNHLGGLKLENPFRSLIIEARKKGKK